MTTLAAERDTVRAQIEVMADIARVRATHQPDDVAMVYQGRETTYRELGIRTSQVANGLIAAGVQPQERVAHLDKNADSFYELLYGTAKSNTVLVSVNWRLAAPEIAFVINDAEAEILFVSADYADVIEGIREGLTHVKTIVCLDGQHPTWEAYSDWRDRQDSADSDRSISPDDVAVQLYTSGTTGHPKGVQLTNTNLIAGLRGSEAYAPLAAGDVNLVVMPFSTSRAAHGATSASTLASKISSSAKLTPSKFCA